MYFSLIKFPHTYLLHVLGQNFNFTFPMSKIEMTTVVVLATKKEVRGLWASRSESGGGDGVWPDRLVMVSRLEEWGVGRRR